MDELRYRFATKEYVQARIAEAMNVAGGGGGGVQAETFEGSIEVMDTFRLQVAKIPIDVSGYDYLIGCMYIEETGDVSGGVVTLDDTAKATSANGDMAWLFSFMAPTKESSIYTNQTRTKTACNITYDWTNSNNGGGSKAINNPTMIGSGELEIRSSGDYMVNTGRYSKFHYKVVCFKV